MRPRCPRLRPTLGAASRGIHFGQTLFSSVALTLAGSFRRLLRRQPGKYFVDHSLNVLGALAFAVADENRHPFARSLSKLGALAHQLRQQILRVVLAQGLQREHYPEYL